MIGSAVKALELDVPGSISSFSEGSGQDLSENIVTWITISVRDLENRKDTFSSHMPENNLICFFYNQ